MKKVYIPTEEEIQKLNYLGVSQYQYLLSKTVETLIMEDVIYENIDMLDMAYEELKELPEIIYGICRIYPERIALSKQASKDITLCQKLIDRLPSQDKSIYHLNTLAYFDQESAVVSDPTIIKNTTRILADKLTSSPRYRFDYKEPNTILDNIFACEISSSQIDREIYGDLISIDPIYAIKLGLDLENEKKKIAQNKSFELQRGMVKYKYRYGIDKIDTTNQQEKTKRLIRCLEYYR